MNELFGPIEWTLPKAPGLVFKYYELRVWRNHYLVEAIHFRTKKEAIEHYYENYEMDEINGNCYVEIIRINPLKKSEK